ncbi:putative RNA-binding Zn ribbon-like protein [Nitrospirillum amazonense]|uniref:Putative RNA-binding Zn ribbon-like protein n=1 Tax=Nitrospirillum amazonense TaxID=28077 RepID=A0A560ETZ2_9PROT|nr:ABATE domain-containing protein [Nitrospirillum amazonense]TWB12843.1 putative RNA-binding Zn ribbon-like protein [Nitrospirillum amazonense]
MRQNDVLTEERDGFRFRGGCPAIDLPATLQARLKPAPRELLATPEDVRRWMVAAGLTDTAPPADEGDLALARRLREAIYDLAVHRHGGSGPPGGSLDSALDVLNQVAALPAATPALALAGSTAAVALNGPMTAFIATVAREAVHLFGGAATAHIRQCQSPTCTLFFVDTSRAGDRRWCSMKGCGTKAKVAEFRRRRREGG